MAAVMLQAVASFAANCSERSYLFLWKHEEIILLVKIFALHATMKNVVFIPMQSEHIANRGHWRDATVIVIFLFNLQTHGLSIYTFQVSVEWQRGHQQ